MTLMRIGGVEGALALWLVCAASAAELKKTTVEAFEKYIRATESRVAEQTTGQRSFLWADESRQRQEQVRQGQVLAQPWNRRGEVDVPDGLIHDWIAAVFIPGATLDATLALVQDYDNHYKIYRPEVIASKTLARDKNHYKIHLRLLKKKVITVVLNTEYDLDYFPLGSSRWHSRSYSTRVAQVEDAGKPQERELPVGKDGGYVWRLYSYWRFEERDAGVWVECEAITLTRDIPTGLGWLVEPIIRDLPREALVRTMEGMRGALKR